jgi:hypothetical protein
MFIIFEKILQYFFEMDFNLLMADSYSFVEKLIRCCSYLKINSQSFH